MPPRRACDLCYKRKIQCVIPTPGDPCDWCSSQGLSCTFVRVIQKDPNKRTTTDVVQELSQRVEELEDALKSAQSANTAGGTSPWSLTQASRSTSYYVTSPTTATGELPTRNLPPLHASPAPTQTTRSEPSYKLSRCHIGNNWYFKGVGIFSLRGRQWISEGAGQREFLTNFDIFGNPPSTPPHPVSTTLPARSKVLPPESTCRYLVGAFLKSKTAIAFPVLDGNLLEETIARAYDVTAPKPGCRTSAEACLWAMLALVSRIEEARQFHSVLEPYECACEAKRLLITIDGSRNLDSLQATLLLWAYQKMKGKCREASITFTSACRMVCDLGGHFLLSRVALMPQHIPTFEEPSRFHIRRLFWLCYCFDKDISLRTGSPPLLTSGYCDVCDVGEWSNQAPWYNRSREISLAKIKEKASRMLCSPRAFQYEEAELLSHVRQLDDELEEWRLSIESGYRPRLSIAPDSTFSIPSSTSTESRAHIINLQLDYLSTMINIHTMVRKCGDFERNLPDDLHSVVHSSADLSIEASRSIFRFLDTVVDFWKGDSVWVVSHYAPMAAMPLFVNIIIHPVGNPADDDLQILASVGNITRNVPTEGLSVEEIGNIQEICDFVMELVRLGHSAAWKVKRGEREHDLDIIHR